MQRQENRHHDLHGFHGGPRILVLLLNVLEQDAVYLHRAQQTPESDEPYSCICAYVFTTSEVLPTLTTLILSSGMS